MTRRDHIRHALDVIYDQIFNKGQVDLLPSLVSGPYIQHPSDVSLLPLSRRRRGKLNMKLSGSHLVFLSAGFRSAAKRVSNEGSVTRKNADI